MPVFYDNSKNEAIQHQMDQVNNAFGDYARLSEQKKAREIASALEQKRLAMQQQEHDDRLSDQKLQRDSLETYRKQQNDLASNKFEYDKAKDSTAQEWQKQQAAAVQSRFDVEQEAQDGRFKLNFNKDQLHNDYASSLVADAKAQGRDLTAEESVKAFGKLPEQMKGGNGAASLDQRQFEFDYRRKERTVQRAQKALDAVTFDERKHMLTGRSETTPEAPKGMETAYAKALATLHNAEDELDAADERRSGGAAPAPRGVPGAPQPAAPGSKGPLNAQTAAEILHGMAGGDKEKARAIAIQMGFTIPTQDQMAAPAPNFSR